MTEPTGPSNVPTFAQLAAMDTETRARLSAMELAFLQDELAERQRQLAVDAAFYESVIAIRYSALVAEAYKKEQKDTGTVNVWVDPDYDLKAQRSKTVVWDQDKLKTLAERIAKSGDAVGDYIEVATTTTYRVGERDYERWPDAIKKVFDDARTVRAGSTKYQLIPRKKEKS